jgi:uncharacterized membrane protein YhaH (DUF805 family)
MEKAQNIYNYKPLKSSNVEVSYFLTKGRITGKAFFLRLLLVVVLYSCSFLVYSQYFIPKRNNIENNINPKDKEDGITYKDLQKGFATQFQIVEQFQIYFLIALFAFLLIQGAKRMHDVNKSGWCFLVPFYNIVLVFCRGTLGQNNYGLDPRPQKVVKYFDELKTE